MALNIKNAEVERLAADVAKLADETKTEAIRRALAERKVKLEAKTARKKPKNSIEYLKRHVWPHVLPEFRGKRVSREEREEILGIGPHGY